jgi:hypothetical protein
MPMRSFGAFGPEAIAEMSKALEAACEELGDTGRPEAVREIVALRIIAAARLGEVTQFACGQPRLLGREANETSHPFSSTRRPFASRRRWRGFAGPAARNAGRLWARLWRGQINISRLAPPAALPRFRRCRALQRKPPDSGPRAPALDPYKI